MSIITPSVRRPLPPAVRAQLLLAASISILALSAIGASAQSQQPQQLPTVPVDPPAIPAQKAVQPKVAPKQQAAPAKAAPVTKALAKRQSAEVAPPAGPSPTAATAAQKLETLPAASAAAAATKLEVQNTTGSALNLTPRETPATVNIVSSQDIEERGARGLVEALRLVPGVVIGNNPGEVATGVFRGFHKAHGVSIDGSRVADPVFLGRDYSAFHFDRIEVLKGPASVVSGTSGLSGSINIITKQATTDRNFVEGMDSYGSFDTWQTGAGFNAVLSPQAAWRSTLSYSSSSGYVDDTDSYKLGFNNNILLKPSDALKITASIDYYKDKYATAYYATPLIQGSVARDPTNVVKSPDGLVLDRSIRYKNYNFNDGDMHMESIWLRGAAEYKLTNQITLKNEVSYYSADRLWRDADFYTYSAGLITRGTTMIAHDHEFWSDRMTFNFDGQVGGMRNRFTAGAEYMATTFGSRRHFGSTPGVSIFEPDRGFYPEGSAAITSRNFESAEHVTKAAFAEHAINLTRAWIVAGGIRYETIDLDRTGFNEVTGVTTTFGNKLDSTTWRIGTTYEVLPGTTLFAQYAEAVTPVSSALMIASPINAGFKLTTGTSKEVGVKSVLLGGRMTNTASIYQIDQDDILTRDPVNSTIVVQGGSQRSRGIEAETAISLTDRWNVSLAGTLIDSEFTDLKERSGGVAVDRTGNRPLNAVPWAWNALMTYRLDWLPATVGAQLVGVGPFYTTNANLYEAKERTTLDAWVTFDVGKGKLRVRGRNLTDEFYAEWADYNATSLYVGAPRSFDVTYSIKW
jgi:iron complex outermembrane receptor protein